MLFFACPNLTRVLLVLWMADLNECGVPGLVNGGCDATTRCINSNKRLFPALPGRRCESCASGTLQTFQDMASPFSYLKQQHCVSASVECDSLQTDEVGTPVKCSVTLSRQPLGGWVLLRITASLPLLFDIKSTNSSIVTPR